MGNIIDKNSLNPFESAEFRGQFLRDKGLKASKGDYELIPPDDSIAESGKIVNPVDVINKASRIPDSVSTVIHDATSLRTPDRIKRSEDIKYALNTIFTEYNKKYNTNLHINLDDTSKMLADISDPESFRVFELYNSELFGRFRSIFLNKMIQGLMLLVDDVLDPKKLLSTDTEYADKWIIIEKAFNYFMMLEQVKDSISIKGAETELNKLGQEMNSKDEGDVRDNKNVREFMEMMLKNSGVD